MRQGKTGKALRIAVVGELATLVNDILGRDTDVVAFALVPVTQRAMAARFAVAREKAAMAADKAKDRLLAESIRAVQLRDLRAKAGSDTADASGIEQAQLQLGHGSVRMTERYVRNRAGTVVNPKK